MIYAAKQIPDMVINPSLVSTRGLREPQSALHFTPENSGSLFLEPGAVRFTYGAEKRNKYVDPGVVYTRPIRLGC